MLKKGQRKFRLPKDVALERATGEVAPLGGMPAQNFESDHLYAKRI